MNKIKKNRVGSCKQIFCCYFYNVLSVFLSQHKLKKTVVKDDAKDLLEKKNVCNCFSQLFCFTFLRKIEK